LYLCYHDDAAAPFAVDPRGLHSFLVLDEDGIEEEGVFTVGKVLGTEPAEVVLELFGKVSAE
jgi:hypothetical protein